MREAIKGLSITSLKWRCRSRQPAFPVGAAVWIYTVCDRSNPNYVDDGSGYRDGPEKFDFPAIVVREGYPKALVFVAEKTRDQEDEVDFSGQRFCAIPISRMRRRDAPDEHVCQSCMQPASAGHISGYSCGTDWKKYYD